MEDLDVPRTPRGAPGFEDGPTLAQYLLVLWSAKWLVLGPTLACAVVALIVSLRVPREYEASVRLLASAPKTNGETGIPQVSVPTLRSFIENQGLANAIVKEFKLGDPPGSMSAESFLERATVENIRDTYVLVLRVRLGTGDLAARVANRLADLAVQLAERISAEEAVKARDFIKVQLDESQKRLDETSAAFVSFRKKAQLDAVRHDVDAILDQRGQLLQLLLDIQSERAQLAKAESQLAQYKPADDSFNAVYEKLEQDVVRSRTKLAGLEKQRAELIDVRKLDSKQLADLNNLYEQESTLSRLSTELELAQRLYESVSTRYQGATLQVAGRSAQLQLLDPALPPARAKGRGTVRNVIALGLFGFLVSTAFVLLRHAVRTASA